MRVIKLALLSFLVFFCIITAMSLFIPARLRISRVTNISQESDSVFYLITNKDQWHRWHPAFQLPDAPALLQQKGISIQAVSQSDSVVTMQWTQAGRTPVVNGWQVHRFAAPDSLALQWYMDFRFQWYPWQKFSSLFYEKTYGTVMEQGLKNIKDLVQKKK